MVGCPLMAARKAKKSPKAPLKKATTKRAKKAAKRAAPAPIEIGEAVEVAAVPAPAIAVKINKTAFVLSQPANTTPTQVAEAAAAEGISISPAYVSKVRSEAKSAGTKAPAKKAPTKPSAKAPKAGKRGPGDGRGSAFIRTQPVTLKASEVVAAAAAEGITITPGLVYTVRKAMNKAGAAPTSPAATGAKRPGRPPAAAKAPAATAPVAAPVARASDRERQLVSLALDIGLARAVELIAGLRSRIDELL